MLNGKFKCTAITTRMSLGLMTVGRTYEFKNGAVILDDGDSYSGYQSLEHWHKGNKDFRLEPLQPQLNSLIQRVLVNGRATVVFFQDGSKSVVVHDDDLPYDQEKALAMCIAKKFLNRYTEFKKVLDSVEVKGTIPINKYATVIYAGSQFTTYTTFFTGEFEKYLPKYVNSDADLNVGYDNKDRISLHNNEKVKVLESKNGCNIVEKSNGTICLIRTNALKFL